MQRAEVLLVCDPAVEAEYPGLSRYIDGAIGVSFSLRVETRVQDVFPRDRVIDGEVDLMESFGFPDEEVLGVGDDVDYVICVTALHLMCGGRLSASGGCGDRRSTDARVNVAHRPRGGGGAR